VTVNKVALSTLSTQDPELYMLSATESHVSQMWGHQGRYRIAIESMLTARNIKLSATQVDLQNVSWTEDNNAILYSCIGDLDTALEWSQRCRATWEKSSRDEGLPVKWPPMQRLTYGRTLSYAKRYDEARRELMQVIEELLVIEPLIWGVTALYVTSPQCDRQAHSSVLVR
jgi:hypothetical protein